MIKLNFPTYLVKIIHQYLDNRTFNVKTIVPPQVFVASPRERLKGLSCRPRSTTSAQATSPPLHQSPSASLPTMPPYTLPPTKQFEHHKLTSPNLKPG
ncbi:hypothetical protein TNCV_3658881 [Trichonephila clavipes]|nr:hypothetical protein TNCV_3658881 [Trichonephila clavipes]